MYSGQNADHLPWFALQVSPNHENSVSKILEYKRYEAYVPTCKVRRQWSDRTKDVDAPLFPGYVLCRMNSGASGLIVTTPGVIRILGFGKQPAPIPDHEVDSIRLMLAGSEQVARCQLPPSGARVRIESGPLAGVQGVVIETNGKSRLVVSIALLQRAVKVELAEGTAVSVVH